MHRALLFVLALAACASPQKPAPGSRTATGGSDDVVCHEVSTTGSLMTHTECTTRADEDQEREDTRRNLQRPHGPDPGPAGPQTAAPGGR